MRDDGDAGAVRRRQLLLFSVIAALLLAGLAAWLGAGGGGARPPEGGIEAGIVAPDAAERVWTLRSEARLGGIETKLREMEREARSLRADNDRLAAKLEADAANAQDVIDAQAATIDELQRQADQAGRPRRAARPQATGGSKDLRRDPRRAAAPTGRPRRWRRKA